MHLCMQEVAPVVGAIAVLPLCARWCWHHVSRAIRTRVR